MPGVPNDPVFVMTPSGEATVRREHAFLAPTQAQLENFVNNNREGITSLMISPEEFDKEKVLNLERLGVLRNLKSLTLGVINVDSIVLTSHNMPGLTNLSLTELDCPQYGGPPFELELPELRKLEIYYMRINAGSDFGQCLSRCPKLKFVTATKFSGLCGSNLAVLPNCSVLSMKRCGDMESLEIVAAPKLRLLSVQACFDMKNVRLWDVPYEITAEDVAELKEEYGRVKAGVEKVLDDRIERWKDGNEGRKAYENGWITQEEIEGFEIGKRGDVGVRIELEVYQEFDEMYEKERKKVLRKFESRMKSLGRDRIWRRNLTKCGVDDRNSCLDQSSLEHLRANKRVQLASEEDEADVDEHMI